MMNTKLAREITVDTIVREEAIEYRGDFTARWDRHVAEKVAAHLNATLKLGTAEWKYEPQKVEDEKTIHLVVSEDGKWTDSEGTEFLVQRARLDNDSLFVSARYSDKRALHETKDNQASNLELLGRLAGEVRALFNLKEDFFCKVLRDLFLTTTEGVDLGFRSMDVIDRSFGNALLGELTSAYSALGMKCLLHPFELRVKCNLGPLKEEDDVLAARARYRRDDFSIAVRTFDDFDLGRYYVASQVPFRNHVSLLFALRDAVSERGAKNLKPTKTFSASKKPS